MRDKYRWFTMRLMVVGVFAIIGVVLSNCQCGRICSPGITRSCACVDGSIEFQTCTPSGTEWESCNCQTGTPQPTPQAETTTPDAGTPTPTEPTQPYEPSTTTEPTVLPDVGSGE